MSKIKTFGLMFVFVLVAWALFYTSQFLGLDVLISFGLLAVVLTRDPAKLRQRDIEKQGFYVEVDSPGLYRGSNLHNFGLYYYEPDGKISFEGTWPPKSKATLTVPSPNEWEIEMPDWAKTRRAVILERIAEANRFMVLEPSINCSKE